MVGAPAWRAVTTKDRASSSSTGACEAAAVADPWSSWSVASSLAWSQSTACHLDPPSLGRFRQMPSASEAFGPAPAASPFGLRQ